MNVRFKRSTWQVNPGSQCEKTACRKEASGNTLHHTVYKEGEWNCVDILIYANNDPGYSRDENDHIHY